eukprot:167044_1
MALKLNPLKIESGRIIGYSSIHSDLNTITLAVILKVDREFVHVKDIDDTKEDENVMKKRWNELYIIAPVITVQLDKRWSEHQQYVLQGCLPNMKYNCKEMYYSLFFSHGSFSTVFYPSSHQLYSKQQYPQDSPSCN